MLSGTSKADGILRSGVGCLAFVAYVLTAAPGAFWLDSGELAAAGVTLGVPHPPGHPLYVMLAYISSWLPMGSAGFRVSLLSAGLAALSTCLVYDLVLLLLRHREEDVDRDQWWDQTTAAIAALVFAAASAVWLQSVRAEVYTLQLALHLWVTRELIHWHLSAPPRPNKHLWRAALGLGLGAANHHLLLVAHVPALLVLFLGTREERPRAARLAGQGVLWGAWGLSIYGLLPVRAATAPLVNYGDPSTLQRFVDVVTARVFQGSVTETSPSLLENLDGALSMYGLSLGPLTLLLALVGLYVLARTNGTLALAFAVAVLCNLATKVSMVLDPSNPDAAGYFQTGMAFVAIAGGLGLRATLAAVRRAPAQVAVAALVTVASGAQAWVGLDRHDLTEHRSPMVTDMLFVSQATPDALWLTSFYGLHFNRLYHVAVDGFRPDVTCIHQGFEGHVNHGRSLADAHRLRGSRVEKLTDAFTATGAFPIAEIQELAGERPIYLEPTLGQPIQATHLDYGGGYNQVLAGPGENPASEQDHARDQRELFTALGPEVRTQRETRVTLMMLLAQRIVVALKRGATAEARRDLQSLMELSPDTPSARRLLPIVEALERASPDPRASEAVKARILATDFTDLFSAP